jgi:DNA-binding XRE family transcriptional regulator
MRQGIGQFVLCCQDAVSQDVWTKQPYRRRVAIDNEEAGFNDALCARVHRLRNERGWTAAQMAVALGVPPERYRKYEYRSPLPHYLLERFALIVGRDIEYVLTGNRSTSRAPAIEERRKTA